MITKDHTPFVRHHSPMFVPYRTAPPLKAPAQRDAHGMLHCSTPGCATESEYAEPDSDGSWTCGACRAVEGW